MHKTEPDQGRRWNKPKEPGQAASRAGWRKGARHRPGEDRARKASILALRLVRMQGAGARCAVPPQCRGFWSRLWALDVRIRIGRTRVHGCTLSVGMRPCTRM